VRPRLLLAAAVLIALGGGTVMAATALARSGDTRALHPVASPPTTAGPTTAGPTATGPVPSTAAAAPVWRIDPAAEVDVDIEGFLAWAALDRTTGTLVTAPNATETSSTESMIKVWIVADHLRRASGQGVEPSEQELEDARVAIRQSDSSAAQRLYERGGQDAMVERMIDICGLADTYIPQDGSGWWSRTEMSAVDAVRLGECVADGTAAGPEWTDWLLEEMRRVVGTTADRDQRPGEDFEGGRWGIIDALPDDVAARVSIKNGWTRIGADGSWHLNCLAVADDWVIAVTMRYPADASLDYGAQRCASVARQLLTEPSP
jgi:hypothetical protein